MLDLSDIDRVVDRAASASLKNAGFSRVYTKFTTDSEGREALHVTIVLRSNKNKEVSGNSALNTIVRVQRDLRRSGEERFPIIEFVTEDELEPNASTQS